MTVDQLKTSLGLVKDKELADKLSRDKSTISKWRKEGIPKQALSVIEPLLKATT